MRIGFSKTDISPPIGTELAGYAGYRPCIGIHDPLYCKTVVLEQHDGCYALVALDLMCVDESLYDRVAQSVAHLGITKEKLIVCAIHSHAAPRGGFPGEGQLHKLNNAGFQHNDAFTGYMEDTVKKIVMACEEAVDRLELFRLRVAQGELPEIGSELHTGEKAEGSRTVLHFQTESGKNLMLYSLPCHPTVLTAANLEVSADFVGQIEKHLNVDLGIFVNGAAGDISTRFTRREQTFEECERMGAVAAKGILESVQHLPFTEPHLLVGKQLILPLKTREIESEEQALLNLYAATKKWEKAVAEGADPSVQRILKSYVEGAGVSLEFSRLMGDIRELILPVSVFKFMDLNVVSIPGELFSTLLPDKKTVAICYANGYDRYIADAQAYEKGYYEAMAAVLAKGQGEWLRTQLKNELQNL